MSRPSGTSTGLATAQIQRQCKYYNGYFSGTCLKGHDYNAMGAPDHSSCLGSQSKYRKRCPDHEKMTREEIKVKVEEMKQFEIDTSIMQYDNPTSRNHGLRLSHL